MNTEITSSKGYLLIHGYVINVSDTDLDCLVAIANYCTTSKTLIKTADMLVEDGNLKPKYISVFDIATSDDQRIGYADLTFKLLLGTEVNSEGATKLQVSRKSISTTFIDYEIRKNIIPKTKKN
jgi:hypothetical protein